MATLAGVRSFAEAVDRPRVERIRDLVREINYSLEEWIRHRQPADLVRAREALDELAGIVRAEG